VRRVPFPSYLHEEPLLSEVRRPYPGDTDLIRRVGVVDLEGGAVEWLALDAPNRRVVLDIEWSPDSERVLVMQGADVAEERWIFVADPEDGSVTQVWQDHRPRRPYPLFRALWSADGEEIYFIGDHEDYYRLYALPAEGGAPRRLTGDFDVAGDRGRPWIQVEPSTGDLLFVSAEHSPYERHVYRLSASGQTSKVTMLPGLHQPHLSPDGQRLALIRSSDTSPSELYWLELDGESPEQRLTQSPLPAFEAIDWIEPEYVSFPSRIDDFRIHARIIWPPDMEPGKRYPVMFGSVYSNTVLNQWNPDRPTSFLQQQMALKGDFITVLVDVRGSVGYGVDFREAFQGDWGRDDLEDLHSAVEFLAAHPAVDPDRIGIWGNSYGGLLVLTGLFKKPGLFAAGVAGAPAVDVWHFTGYDQHLTRRPDTHPEIFERGSLLDLGEGLNDPLLIIHGVHDDIVPLKTTLMMAEKLKLLGKTFELDIVHDSGHWWAASDHYARYTFGRLVDFMHRHVPPGPK
jgi:dipeptidyl-peptidase-4